MINGLIWNARGVGNKETKRRLKRLCKSHCLYFLAILEHMIDSSKSKDLRRIINSNGCSFNNVNKIWCVWIHVISSEVLVDGEKNLLLKVDHPLLKFQIGVNVVYAKVSRQERRFFLGRG